MNPWRAALTSATASGNRTRIASRSAIDCSSTPPCGWIWDSAAAYARDRARTHADRFGRLAALVASGDRAAAVAYAARLRAVDGPFGHLDARRL